MAHYCHDVLRYMTIRQYEIRHDYDVHMRRDVTDAIRRATIHDTMMLRRPRHMTIRYMMPVTMYDVTAHWRYDSYGVTFGTRYMAATMYMMHDILVMRMLRYIYI
jgi:hypothetical protein